MSDETYTGHCPVVACPFNQDWIIEAENNCLVQTANHDYSSENLALLTGVDNTSEFKENLVKQTNTVLGVARKLHQAIDSPAQFHCPNCGYLRPCASQTLCQQRQEVYDVANVELQNSLSRKEFWWMLAFLREEFLPTRIGKVARQLLSNQDQLVAVK